MKTLNLVLVLALLACYSGYGSGLAYSSIRSNQSNCHSIKRELRAPDKLKGGATVYYLSEHVMKPGAFRCCFESLTNAPHKEHMSFKDLILDASLIDNSKLETSKILNSSLSVSLREHDPPDLYVSNSSLLL
jgi:hypothetical protein